MTYKKIVAVVFPVFNEAEIVEEFLNQLVASLKESSKKYQFVFCAVNNGSQDMTFERINQFPIKFGKLVQLVLTRNFGYEAAFEAGLREIDADIYCLIDADGEDPVNLIPHFLNKLEEGFHIAYGIRVKRHESKLIQLLRKLFYKVLSVVADDPFWRNAGEFSAFTRQVRTSILSETNSFPFWRASLARTGYLSCGVEHDRNPRIGGKSKLNRRKMLEFAIAGILSSTTWPLRANAYLLGFGALFFGLSASVNLLFGVDMFQARSMQYLFLVFLCTSLISVMVYQARIYKNTLNRKNYHIIYKTVVTPNTKSFSKKKRKTSP